MKLIIEWNTPEECIEQIAQIYYLRATNYADANGPYHWPGGLPWTPIS